LIDYADPKSSSELEAAMERSPAPRFGWPRHRITIGAVENDLAGGVLRRGRVRRTMLRFPSGDTTKVVKKSPLHVERGRAFLRRVTADHAAERGVLLQATRR